jgi:predicted amidohydrolase YtcJ
MDLDRPETEAIAARGQEIVGIGLEEEIRRLIGSDTEVIDIEGALAVPGLIEGHGHFLGLGRSRMQLELTSAATWDEIVDTVAAEAREAPPGQWILGRGWHQEKWQRPPDLNLHGLPYNRSLSHVSPDNPVFLTHASGHAAVVNARAMELGGISATTPDPPGGEIVRDAAGHPIGVLLDTANDWVEGLLTSRVDEATLRREAELATAECLSKGITSFQDAGSTFGEVDLLRQLAENGELGVRLWVMLADDDATLAERLPGFHVRGVGDGFLTVAAIKRWLDGALGSYSAWLLEPYQDVPGSTGLNVVAPEDLRVAARIALSHGLQLCTHAIGDRANREALDVYQEVLGKDAGQRDHRWRIEHVQHLHPDDVGRFARLGVVAAMQPNHCTSDGPWVPKRLGDRRGRERSYLWRSLLDSGALIVSGTDTPVEDVDPIANYHAAVTREMPDGTAFYPSQAMTRYEALRAATFDAAYAAFEDDVKGSLVIGKLADITVLSKDVLEIPVEEIADARVLYTIVGGEVRYRADP